MSAPEEKQSVAETPPKRGPAKDRDGLYKRKLSGIWYHTIVVNGHRRFLSTRTRNYSEARRIRAEVTKLASENKLPSDRGRGLFSKVFTEFLEERQTDPRLSAGTKRVARERSKPLIRFFGARRTSSIDAH